ncbi:MAG: extensin family protein [Beijerinckiaceae bacterium]
MAITSAVVAATLYSGIAHAAGPAQAMAQTAQHNTDRKYSDPKSRHAVPAGTAQPAKDNASANTQPDATLIVDREICHAQLTQLGAEFSREHVPAAANTECSVATPVRLTRIKTIASTITLPDRPVLDCRAAILFSSYARDLVQPLARHHFANDMTMIATGPGYECRGRNRVAGAKISAHGRGLAVDIMRLEAGPVKVVIETPANAAQEEFIAAMRKAACGWFTTVLGPGSDKAHASHLHFDSERRGRDGQSRLCQ